MVVLEVDGADPAVPGSLDALIPVAWQAALLAYRNAYYDQAALDSALAAAGRGGGTEVDPYCCFNDVRGPAGAAAPADPAALRLAIGDTTVAWTPADSSNWRFYLEIRTVPCALAVVLTADTRAVPPDRFEQLLRQFETLVVESAAPSAARG